MSDNKLLKEAYKERTIIGLIEDIEIFGPNGNNKNIQARIDTGATRSSIDKELAEQLKLGPVTRTRFVKQALGGTVRPIIVVEFDLAGKRLKKEFTIADRNHMKYRVLIGQNALNQGFLIDPHKE
ncbi:MAG: RimK/LysX family protein [Nanoarchaeota archaeon]|nr:RimK/LysX family protein [Nanoarchaeota archaeon]